MPGQAAVVGVGESEIGRIPGRSALDLMNRATENALASAGLDRSAIDGLITSPIVTERWVMPAAVVARGLGITPIYLNTVDLAGASGVAMVDQAARAVATGACECVLCVAAQPLLSGLSGNRAIELMAEGAAHAQAETPAGPSVPSLYALLAARHFYQYGTTSAQLATVAVEMRRHAGLNENAHFRKPITMDEVLRSKPIASPLRLLDCAPVSDGGAALLVVSAERAKQIKRRAAYLLGSGYGLSHAYLSDATDPLTSGAVQSGQRAFQKAALVPADMDFACLYDCFTITLLLELEDLGFCARGESGPAVASGWIGRHGGLPVNPGGGLLSAGHPGLPAGLLPVAEAAKQIMREAGQRQLARADLAIAHGNGGVLGMHCSLIFGSADV